MMRNILLAFLAAFLMFSCDKNALQQTADHLHKADSLFTKANHGIKKLDSITKAISDSDGIAKTVLPEIKRQTKKIDSTFKSGGFEMDSINKEIKKITRTVKVNTEVIKSLDSANASLKKGENALAVLSRTADHILKATKTDKTPEKEQSTGAADNSSDLSASPKAERQPLEKTALLEIEVDDLEQAKALLNDMAREHNATTRAENFSQTEGRLREDIRLRVPLQNFDSFVASVSEELGNVTLKNLESTGEAFEANHKGEVEISLFQNEALGGNAFGTDKENGADATETSTSSQAFMQGFEGLKKVGLVLLPFWPLFLIAGLVIFLVRRHQLKKAKQAQASETISTVREQTFTKENPPSVIPTEQASEPDYSKYQPKQ